MIQVSENLRIFRYNRYNIVIEERVLTRNPKTKEESMNWKFRGYFGTFKMAIRRAFELLSTEVIVGDNESVTDILSSIESITNLIRESEQKVCEAASKYQECLNIEERALGEEEETDEES